MLALCLYFYHSLADMIRSTRKHTLRTSECALLLAKDQKPSAVETTVIAHYTACALTAPKISVVDMLLRIK